MPMTLEDFYYLMQHPINSAGGTYKELMNSLALPTKKKGGGSEVVPPPAPIAAPATPTPAPAALPTSTIPSGSGEEALINYNTNRKGKIDQLRSY